MSSSISTTGLPVEALVLGSPTAEYAPQTGRTAAGGIVFLVAAALCIAVSVGSYLQGDYTVRLLVIMGILILAFLGGAVWQFSLAIGNRSLRIIVFDQGVARINGAKADILRWDDISQVYQQVTDHYRYGVKINTSHIYTIHLQNGRKVVYNDVIKNVQALGETIQKEAAARLLPRYAETLASGERLTFNKLILSKTGIGTSKETVPWDQIDAVKLDRGMITVTKQGKPLGGFSQTAAQTPNLFVFLTLVERIKG